MAVRETEKYLPSCGAPGLGQSCQSGKYFLVSYLVSPVPRGLAIDYVVFATDDAQADSYSWLFTEIPSGVEVAKTTTTGIAKYEPTTAGTVQVEVRVNVGSVEIAALGLAHDVIEPAGHLFTRVDSILAATIGDSAISLEVLHAFKPFILEAVADPAWPLPPSLLAAIVYSQASAVDSGDREREVSIAEYRLNAKMPEVTSSGLGPKRLGVCQLAQEVAAMVAPRPSANGSTTYIAWDELPAKESERDAKRKALRDAYVALPSKDRIELHNLLRFPKANIRTAAVVLAKLKSRAHRWPGLTADQLLSGANENALQILATEYLGGASLAPRPSPIASGPAIQAPPSPDQARPSRNGKAVAGLIGKPFIWAHFGGLAEISGVVRNRADSSPIRGAQVALRQTIAKIEASDGLMCYRAPELLEAGKIAILPRDGEFGVLEIRWESTSVRLKVDTPHGEAWINARGGTGTPWNARIFDGLVPGGAALTDEQGRFSCRVTRRHMYRLHAFCSGYFDSDSDRFMPPRSDLAVQLDAVSGAIREEAILKRLKHFAGYRYVHGPLPTPPPELTTDAQKNAWLALPAQKAIRTDLPRYPYAMPNVTLDVVEGTEAKVNDCTTFTEGLLIKAWKDVNSAFAWSLALHNQWMIVGETAATRFSTMVAAQTADMVVGVDSIAPSAPGVALSPEMDAIVPSPWTLVQVFKNPPQGSAAQWGDGHSFIIVDTYPAPGANRNLDKVLILESNLPSANFKIDGPGFRMIGDIDDANLKNFSPGRDWWNDGDLPTWGKLKTDYPYLRLARLKVYDLKWVR